MTFVNARILTVKHWLVLTAVAFALMPSLASAQDEVIYYHTDAVGSVRMITDASGAEVERDDFLPFGERWSPPPSPLPNTRQFAGKEREVETALDYFGARSVLNIEAALTDPQRWNRYSYAANNPLRFVDPDGREIWLSSAHQRALSDAGQRAAPLAAVGIAAAAIAGVTWAGPIAWRAAVGCFLSSSCQLSALEILESGAGGPPRVGPTGDVDDAATALAQRIGGRASVAIEGFGNREFDAVSQHYVAQTFGTDSALAKPGNFLSLARRNQIRATLEAANATGRRALFEFRHGVHQDVLDFIERNANRIGAKYDVRR